MEVRVIAVAVTSKEKWVSSIFITMTEKHHTTLSFTLFVDIVSFVHFILIIVIQFTRKT